MTVHQKALKLCLATLLIAGAAAEAQQGRPTTRRDTTFEVYGFAMLDGIFDFGENNPAWFDVMRPTKLPRFEDEFGNSNRTWVGVRQSRLGVRATFPLGKYDLKTVFEFDLFGVGVDAGQTTIRPRLIYGQWGPFGAGQLPTPFMDPDVFPNILEYWGPNGMIFFRNPQIFWQPLEREDGTKFTVALERPGASADAGFIGDRIELDNVIARFPWPDLSAGFQLGRHWGHVRIAGIVRDMRWDDNLVDTFDLAGGTTGAGVTLSAILKAGKDNVFRLQGVYGRGIQNYFNDAPVDVAVVRNLANVRTPFLGTALPIWSVVAFLDHNWTSRWSTSVGYSSVTIDNSNGQLPDAFRVGQYGILNLLHAPYPNVLMGGELQWGRRRNFDDDFDFNDYRIQFGFKYLFSRKWGGQGR